MVALLRSARAPVARIPVPVVWVTVAVGLGFLAWTFLVDGPAARIAGGDAFAYWSVDLADPYRARVGEFGAFNYSPPVAALASLGGLLPWRTFLTLWTLALVGTAVWLGGRRALLVLAFPPVAIELYYGNINLLIAAVVVLGVTRPWTWAFVLLTKPTCGIGLLWFVARGEWRRLAVALGATLAIVAGSVLLLPGAWQDWLGTLWPSAEHPPANAWLPIPVWVRLPVAGALVWWGARTDREWTLPVAATIALPVIWFAGLSILAALVRSGTRQPEPEPEPEPELAPLFEGQRPAPGAALIPPGTAA